ncbi:hypothetical protein GUA87_10580 [Sneathiella sp. P13V-1]|uniref:TadE/TadG family type IV pilus assembly protein n=1 Tax=Sneathiella sp. P13V-1 TaxID=2697366 RepID=UPI00187B177D|nr:TadE family protein [Sneathiella sp. P13V-1]MBE7637291.1 hypothetical protein [Sneathiella sp. P13V-1]
MMWHRFIENTEGSTLVEAAITMPFVIFLFLGGVDLNRVVDMEEIVSDISNSGLFLITTEALTPTKMSDILKNTYEDKLAGGELEIAFQFQLLEVNRDGRSAIKKEFLTGQAGFTCYIDVTDAALSPSFDEGAITPNSSHIVVGRTCARAKGGFFLSSLLPDFLVNHQVLRQIKDPLF